MGGILAKAASSSAADVVRVTPSSRVSDAAILTIYQGKDEFFRPEVVVANVQAADKRLRSSRTTVLRPNVNGFEMRAIRDILRNHGYVVDAPERGFYHAIDQLTVSLPT